jgi:hypothetical protein
MGPRTILKLVIIALVSAGLVSEVVANEGSAVAVTIEASVPSQPRTEGSCTVWIENTTTAERAVELNVAVYDFFQKRVAFLETEQIQVATGRTERQLMFPADDAKYYRAEARWRRPGGEWQVERVYANNDFFESGPRRWRRIESGVWQTVVPDNTPPTEPPYPPVGEWLDEPFPFPKERDYFLTQWRSGSDNSYKLRDMGPRNWMWIRRTIDPQGWISGKRVQLRVAQADYSCYAFVNGTKVGHHIGGGTPFAFDITDAWKAGETNVVDLAVGSLTTIKRDPNKDQYFNCISPTVMGMAGVYEGVTLVAHDNTFIDDVFVKTSVERGELRVRTWLQNEGDIPVTILLGHRVEDQGEVALEFQAESVSLSPGERRLVEQVHPWPDPKLWWPHAPHLYRLRTQLVDKNEAARDELSTRFGFREITLDGINVLFNGKIFRPLMGTLGSPATPTSPQPTRRYLENRVYEMSDFPSGDPILMRTHQRPHTKWQIELADEMGICIEAESQMNSVVYYPTEDPRFWDNAYQHWAEYIRRDRNSPSVVMWSVANEMLHASNSLKVQTRDELAASLKSLMLAMKDLDPTRPVVEEGGADIDGTWEMLDLHYPRHWNMHVDFPNDVQWLASETEKKYDSGHAPFSGWRRDKPLSIGEDGSYQSYRPPHDAATRFGDKVYIEPSGYRISAPIADCDQFMFAGYIEGYRRTGVWRHCLDLGGSGGPIMYDAMRRVRTFVWPKGETFFAGSELRKTVTIMHDALEEKALRFSWNAVAFVPDIEHNYIDEQEAESGETELDLAAGDHVDQIVSFEVPESDIEYKLVLTLTLAVASDGDAIHSQELTYWIYPDRKLAVQAGAKIGVFDPAGKTIAAIDDSVSAEVTRIDEVTQESLADLQALVIGELAHSVSGQAQDPVRNFVRSGGKVIVLRQTGSTGLDLVPVNGLKRERGIAHTHAFVRAAGHPLLSGVGDVTLKLWLDDHVVSTDALHKHSGDNFLPLIDAGGTKGSGLAFASMAEIRHGKGSYVLCQLRLAEASANQPGARMLLQNLLTYASAPLPDLKPAGTLLAKDSPVRSLLDDLGVETIDLVGGKTFYGVGTIVVDDTGIIGRAMQLRDFVDAGGNVLVKGLTPENREAFTGLLGDSIKVVADTQTFRPIQARPDPLLRGISNEELYWERRKSKMKSLPKDMTATRVYDALITPGAGMTALYRTESRVPVREPFSRPSIEDRIDTIPSRGAGLVKIPVGRGLIIIDQVRWEAAYEKQPKSHGGTVTFKTGVKRYVSYLLSNLGVLQGAARKST